ncbi:Hsp20/alpha crystallin family protein [Litorilinea aerophila]|uniref:Hsp20/alpha crystallin family protein n=1 Tax=Litorilinea aerophila TaxID=1204385 RepID=A0A540VHA8_9CHLR|nr:Hsp20/alpha crystallin family protein [Litorilinea aerophila]MCC9076822.1 Hsp20/alpha crystallin family protein [Litorilinea aerophila]OUC05262.1 heat-shock protein Hsp20 [Litorilinea aerophila]GIV76602.1 MAG: heat-shock protein Hsp20 [Litorilinea sp.]
MTALTRWDPFREMATFREMMDRLFDESFFEAPRLWSRRLEGFSVPMDVIETENEYIVKASLPGVDPNDVEITLTDNVLTIKGQTKSEQEYDEQNYHLRERRFGSFSRSLTLPASVDADKVEAIHEHGVLTLHLPKVESAKPKKIAVKSVVNGG